MARYIESNSQSVWTWRLFAIYTFCSIILPSGNIGGINIKLLIFFLLIIGITTRTGASGLKPTAWIIALAIPALLLLWVLVFLEYGYSDISLSLREFKDIYATVVGALLVYFFSDTDKKKIRFARLVIFSLALVAGCKLFILLFCLAFGIPVAEIMQGISDFFRTQLMTYDLEGIGRIQFLSDNLIPVAIFSVIFFKSQLKMKSIELSIIISLFVFSAAIGFSRYVWVYSAVALFGALVTSSDNIQKWRYIAVIGLTIGVLATYYGDFIFLIYEARTEGGIVDASDQARTDQLAYLWRFFWDAPLFGHGLGSYVYEFVRDENAKYSYENQILALFGQIGVVGILIILISLIFYYGKLLVLPISEPIQRLFMILMLCLWLASGLFNPSLMSTCAGTCFGLFYVLATFNSKPSKQFLGNSVEA